MGIIGNKSSSSSSRWKFFSFPQFPSSSYSSSSPVPAASYSPPPTTVAYSSSVPVGGIAVPLPPPVSFLCPISSRLMSDPVILPTGHTFDRACVQACIDLDFTPPSLLLLPHHLTAPPTPTMMMIPNVALKAAILDWCQRSGQPHPSPFSPESARALVTQNFFLIKQHHNSNPNPNPDSPPISPRQQLERDNKQTKEEAASINTNQRGGQSLSSSSCCSTTSSCPSSSSSSSSSGSSFSSSEINLTASSSSSSSSSSTVDDTKPLKSSNTTAAAAAASTAASTSTAMPITTTLPSSSSLSLNTSSSQHQQDQEEETILTELKSPQSPVKEAGLVALRHSARDGNPQRRISLCTPRILAALVPLIRSPIASLQANATAALVNLSLEPRNKVRIVRAGAVPPLVDALRSTARNCSGSLYYSEEARSNAAGALFSLSLEDENKLVIGVLGAIPPLVKLFCQPSAGHLARVEAGMALYHLSLAPNNLSKIAKAAGAVKALVNIATSPAPTSSGEGEEEAIKLLRLRLQRLAMMVLASIGRRDDGRVALMDADAVRAMVGVMQAVVEAGWKEGGGGGNEYHDYCLAVMYEMSKGKGCLRFRALARAAGVERVLLAMADHHNQADEKETVGRGEAGKVMVRRILKAIRGGDERRGVSGMLLGEEEGEDEDEDDDVGSVDGLVSFQRGRRRYEDFGRSGDSTPETNSANF